MSGLEPSTLRVDVVEAFEDLVDDQLDLLVGELVHVLHFVLDHVLEVIVHVLEDDVLDQLVLRVPRVVEVLVKPAYQDLDDVRTALYVEQDLVLSAERLPHFLDSLERDSLLAVVVEGFENVAWSQSRLPKLPEPRTLRIS